MGEEIERAPKPRAANSYEQLVRLADNALAEVFVGRPRGKATDRLMVIKRIRPEPAHDPQFVSTFMQDVQAAVQLQHANIVRVLDVGLEAGELFCAMEYLHGKSLAAVLAAHRARATTLPIDATLTIISKIGAGLDYAHSQQDARRRPLGIVHRALSPSNVFITYDGEVKLMDFGIARAANRVAAAPESKPGYLSPEQCRGEPLDHRSDIYCVGILLYELTLGQLPWIGTDPKLWRRQGGEGRPIPPSQRDSSYPEQLQTIVMRAMAAAPEDRYQMTGELQQALEFYATDEKLNPSAAALAEHMTELFGDEVERWHRSQEAGLSLEAHLMKSVPAGALPREGTREDSRQAPPARPLRQYLALIGAIVVAAVAVAVLVGALLWQQA